MRIAYVTAGAAGMFCGSCMHDNTLAAALIALGHELHMTMVAEGVETPAQAAALRAIGCELAQGYHLGHPGPREQVWAVHEG